MMHDTLAVPDTETPTADRAEALAPAPSSREMTARAVAAGVLFGALFGAANAYLGLRVGMTVSTSIPVAVMTVAAFRAFGTRASLLEANMAQTIGSASTALATGSIFTLPALFLWEVPPAYLQMVAIALLGGVLGISAMIPLRRLLIVASADELPYPEGRACAEVLRATSGSARQGAWIFRGMFLGAAVKLALGLFHVLPEELRVALPVLPHAELALEVAPALLAVGYILGFRGAGVVVSGSVLSAVVLIPLVALLGEGRSEPLAPATKLVSAMSTREIWSQYVRYIGAGAVAFAGITTVVRTLPSMARSMVAVVRGLRAQKGAESEAAATDRDLPPGTVLLGLGAVVLLVATVPGVLGGDVPWPTRLVGALAIGVLGIAFVTVASRIVGLVGVSSQPTSGITLVTLLVVCGVFAAAGWRDTFAKVTALLVGAVVAIAASKAGDISQDLKTGQLVGATPWRQQLGQYVGAATACWAVAATMLFLSKAYSFGSPDLPAPQATLMKTIVEGVLAGTLPWSFVVLGGGVAASAMLAGVSGLAFAIGVYLPLAAMAAIFVGGVARLVADRLAARGGTSTNEHGDAGVLAASGIVAGEGLAGVVVAAVVGGLHWKVPQAPALSGGAGSLGAMIVVGASAAFLVRARRSA